MYKWGHRGRPQAPPQVLGRWVAPQVYPVEGPGLSVCMFKQLNLSLPRHLHLSHRPPAHWSHHIRPPDRSRSRCERRDSSLGVCISQAGGGEPSLGGECPASEPHANCALLEAGPQAPSRHRDVTATLTVQLGKEGSDCRVCTVTHPEGSAPGRLTVLTASRPSSTHPPSCPPRTYRLLSSGHLFPAPGAAEAHSIGCPAPGPAPHTPAPCGPGASLTSAVPSCPGSLSPSHLGRHPLQCIPAWKDSLAQDTGLSVHFHKEGRLPGPLGHLGRQAAHPKKSILYPSPSLKSSFNNFLCT